MQTVINFVLHSLGSDLKSKGPSIDRGELHRLMSWCTGGKGLILGQFLDRYALMAAGKDAQKIARQFVRTVDHAPQRLVWNHQQVGGDGDQAALGVDGVGQRGVRVDHGGGRNVAGRLAGARVDDVGVAAVAVFPEAFIGAGGDHGTAAGDFHGGQCAGSLGMAHADAPGALVALRDEQGFLGRSPSNSTWKVQRPSKPSRHRFPR